MQAKGALQAPIINQWRLFWLICLPISATVCLGMLDRDLTAPEGVSSMIQLSVRLSVPWLFLAFSASSVQKLFPGEFGRWLVRNRKILGLSFATGMAWQLLFILWLVNLHTQYYANEVYVLKDAIEGVLGYSFLIAMTLTSFKFGRKRLSARQWKLLHTVGIYYLWGYAFIVYWYNLFYYQAPEVLDYLYYWAGVTAWALRMTAWYKVNLKGRGKDDRTLSGHALVTAGSAIIVIGVVGAIFGKAWSGHAFELLGSSTAVSSLSAVTPYFPFEPFYPLFAIMLGAYLLLNSQRRLAASSTVTSH